MSLLVSSWCESNIMNASICAGAYNANEPKRCFTTDYVNIDSIVANFSTIVPGAQGLSCTNPAKPKTSGASKLKFGALLAVVLAASMTGAQAQFTNGHCASSTAAVNPFAAAAPCDGQDPNYLPAPRCGINFYSDANCQNQISSWEANINPNLPYGCGACPSDAPTGLPQGTVYAKTNEHFYPPDKLFVIGSGVCVDFGPNDAQAIITQSNDCYQLGGLNGGEQYECFPNGCTCKGTGGRESQNVAKRDATCSGFTKNGDGRRTKSRFTKVSDVVNCEQSATPCAISVAQGTTASYTSELTLTLGGTVGGVNIGATFGSSYTESYTTTVTYTDNVPVGQCGYLSSYSDAMLFDGTYTGCGDPDTQPGTALVVKPNSDNTALTIVACD